jgi:1-deoxy-D-xylulose-5-phosphate reductoisomerase
VVSAIVGVAGLEATHAAILAGKPVGLANKECMVAAGEILTAPPASATSPSCPSTASTMRCTSVCGWAHIPR